MNTIVKCKKIKERHILVVARSDANDPEWLAGRMRRPFYWGSNNVRFWNAQPEGFTLWIIINQRERTLAPYWLAYRFDRCRLSQRSNRFGKFTISGDPSSSAHFAEHDATRLLLAMRFASGKPVPQIDSMTGGRFEVPRPLSEQDVALLKQEAAEVDRWSVFISYHRTDKIAGEKVSETLRKAGVLAFRDLDALRGGENWRQPLDNAIGRCGSFVALIGTRVRPSEEVSHEIRQAIVGGCKIVPIQLHDGLLADAKRQTAWARVIPNLASIHAPPLDTFLRNPRLHV